MKIHVLVLLAVFCMCPLVGFCAYTNTSHVVDGAGQWTTGGSYSNINAIAQPSGVSVSGGGTLVNYAGFLSSHALRRTQNTDGDGVIDEFDPDNDNDQLADGDELTGGAFSPVTATDLNNPDSDGDGVSDGHEATAGTDPQDPMARFIVTGVTGATNGTRIIWVARSNKTYHVLWSTNLVSGSGFVPCDTVTVSGAASAPWYVVTNSHVVTKHVLYSNGFYRLLVKP